MTHDLVFHNHLEIVRRAIEKAPLVHHHAFDGIGELMRYKPLKFNGQSSLEQANKMTRDMEKIFDVI